MIWCWNLLFGIFFCLYKASVSRVPKLVFPLACYDDGDDVMSLKETVDLKLSQSPRAWMNVLNSDSYRLRCEGKSCHSRTSVICQKTFNMSQLVKKKAKLYINVKLEQQVYYSCPFTFLLYSGNSVQPLKVIYCWMSFDETLHWPDTNLTLAVKFNRLKAGNMTKFTDTKLILRAGTCVNCFNMMEPQTLGTSCVNCIKKEPQTLGRVGDSWHVRLPVDCATRACLEYKPFSYTIVAFSGLYLNEPSKVPCYVTFDIQDDSSVGARVTTCLQLLRRKNNILPYDNQLLLILKIDAVVYMEFTTGGLKDFWCLPDEWIRRKSTLTLQWKGGNYVCDKKPWILYVKSNITGQNYFRSCHLDPYQEKITTNVSQEYKPFPEITGSGSNTNQSYKETVDSDSDVLEWTLQPAGFLIAFVTAISVVVFICGMRRQRLRAEQQNNQSTRQTLQQRSPPSTADNNTTHGQTRLEELTPVLPLSPARNDEGSTDLDLPPPYPGIDIPPPSYDEVCQFLPEQSQNVL